MDIYALNQLLIGISESKLGLFMEFAEDMRNQNYPRWAILGNIIKGAFI